MRINKTQKTEEKKEQKNGGEKENGVNYRKKRIKEKMILVRSMQTIERKV